MIENHMVIGTEITGFNQGLSPHKNCRLQEDVEGQQVGDRVLGVAVPVQKLAISCDHDPVPVYHPNFGMFGQGGDRLADGVRAVIEVI